MISGFLFYENFFNPICLYTIVWIIAVTIHESDLIVYYDFHIFTWIVILVSHVLFVLGCVVAKLFYHTEVFSILSNNEHEQKVYLHRAIFLCLVVSGFAIVANLKMMIEIYGFNLFENLMVIYQDRLENDLRTELIPYLSSFLFIALPLIGIDMKKNGFSIFVVIGLFFACANSLTSGGRAGVIFSLILFYSAYKCSTPTFDSLKRLSLTNGKKTAVVIICVVALVSMVVAVSQQRSAGVGLDYATEEYTEIFGENVPLYKGLVYLASPVAVLNEYLQDCDFEFGKNTFVSLYNILAKFGVCQKVSPYQSYYSTPSSCNVGTWVRELVEDFTLPGAIFLVSLFGFLSSTFYYNAHGSPNVTYKVVWSIFSLVITLSFFDWKFRTSNLWIALFLGIIIGCYIDRKTKRGKK
ncbi:MAG: oligosaccharide repeat unit polymerase, partial [Clostridia bacterium]|nr:oligosaccharide repeat unit polymerase [Clostridia bacterium]